MASRRKRRTGRSWIIGTGLFAICCALALVLIVFRRAGETTVTTVPLPVPAATQRSPVPQTPATSSRATPTPRAGALARPVIPEGLVRARITNVVDGDTVDVLIDGQTERLRLIGIDTPETVRPNQPVECFGREASAFAQALLNGQDVLLEDDPSQDDRDRFGRLLRYVWLPDGRLVNYEMIVQGYAFEYTYALPYTYQAQFRAAQLAAREAQTGLWSPSTCNGERQPSGAATPVSPATTAPTAALPAATPLQTTAHSLPPSFNGCRPDPNSVSAPNAPVAIVNIDKRAEEVTLKNVSDAPINLDGWIMCSIRGNQTHTGIGGILGPGETRVFRHAGDGTIWSNAESDPGALYDPAGRLVAYWPDR